MAHVVPNGAVLGSYLPQRVHVLKIEVLGVWAL